MSTNRKKTEKNKKNNIKGSTKKNKAKAKYSKKYRKIKLYYNLIFCVLLAVVLIYGILHVFTKKSTYRDEGIKYYESGEYEAAIESFNKALKCKQWFSESVDVDIELYKADSYVKLMDYSTASKVYSSIEAKYPEKYYDREKIDFLIQLTDALYQYKYGDYSSTVVCFNQAVEKGYKEISIYSADCYEKAGEFEKMKNYLDIYTESFGYTPDICYKYAGYYIQLEDYDNALLSIEQGLTYGDSIYTQDFLYAQILCYTKADNYEKAYELASAYTEDYPDDTKGSDIYAYLDTRVNPDTEVVNDIFNQNGKDEEELASSTDADAE